MTFLLNLLLFVLVLGVIVCIHEFGHFMFAKITGVYVYEFSIGMGPKIFSRKGKETEYSLRAIPIGGYCQLAGEDVDDDDDKKVPKNRRLQDKSCFKRFLIMFFGAGNNFISAILILFIIGLFWGGTTMKPVINDVSKDYPAYAAGIESGDVVKKLNGHKVTSVDDLSLYLALAKPNKKSTFVVLKDNGKEETYKFKPKKEKAGKDYRYVYGISLKQEKLPRTLGNAFKYTYQKTCSLFKQMFITVGALFTGHINLNQLSGPVGIFSVVGESSKAGVASVLYLIAFLSINVGVINLLPLPAFDGGHIVFLIIEKIKGSPVSPEFENKVHTIGLIILMLLMVIITINDIIKLF